MHTDHARRRALAQLSAASLAGMAPWASAQKPLTVGVIYVGRMTTLATTKRMSRLLPK